MQIKTLRASRGTTTYCLQVAAFPGAIKTPSLSRGLYMWIYFLSR